MTHISLIREGHCKAFVPSRHSPPLTRSGWSRAGVRAELCGKRPDSVAFPTEGPVPQCTHLQNGVITIEEEGFTVHKALSEPGFCLLLK